MNAAESGSKPCVLHSANVSNFSSRARLAVYHHKLEDVVDIVPPMKPDERASKQYREIMHPFGKFPVLQVHPVQGVQPELHSIFETEPIVQYLIARFASLEDPLARISNSADSALLNAKCEMYVRLHDTYTAVHQAALYRAGYSLEERHNALDAIDESLGALERFLSKDSARSSPELSLVPVRGCESDALSRADFAWFPTAIYLEFIPPRWFGRCILDSERRPHFTAWFRWMKSHAAGKRVHAEMWGALQNWDDSGRWTAFNLEPQAPALEL